MVPFYLLFPVAILAGFVGAMSGMGGGIILIPALTLLGVDIKQAIAISILSVIATSSGSASAYVRDHITNLKIGMFLEMFTILGALAGAAITLAIPPRPLYIAFGIVLLGSWIALLVVGHETWHGGDQDSVSRWLELEGSYFDQAQGDRKSTRLNSSHPSISYAVFCLKKKNELSNLLHDYTTLRHLDRE